MIKKKYRISTGIRIGGWYWWVFGGSAHYSPGVKLEGKQKLYAELSPSIWKRLYYRYIHK